MKVKKSGDSYILSFRNVSGKELPIMRVPIGEVHEFVHFFEKIMKDKEIIALTALRESNAIEGVFDNISLSDSVDAWNYLLNQDVITNDVVRRVHTFLMANQPIESKYKGEYRDVPVYVGGRECCKSGLIGAELFGWLMDMNKHGNSGSDWQELHVRYERIHPFIDGNGRTGRMFMNWYRLKNGLETLIIWENEKQEYYKWF